MDELAKIGKRKTLIISISVLIISIHTIYLYQSSRPELDSLKLTQQIVRFFLTVGLLYATYIGKNWARIITVILFTLAVIGAIYGIISTLEVPILNTVPFYVMVLVYGKGISHFGFSKSYKAFSKYQNWIRNNQ
ncbi:hypothetical protein [Psychroserpens damuponensis]|uniref:hypothetical protein n=1 Tax=Psychroserpens damuponensis TaxID=943936 RepID=UPI000590B7A1|nr:hypothetical protein [Psychroserpens damuponensis]